MIYKPAANTSATAAQRLALLTAYEAMEDAGLVAGSTQSTQKDRVGVFYGVTSNDWMETNSAQNIGILSFAHSFRRAKHIPQIPTSSLAAIERLSLAESTTSSNSAVSAGLKSAVYGLMLWYRPLSLRGYSLLIELSCNAPCLQRALA